jgi:hypothetical protein
VTVVILVFAICSEWDRFKLNRMVSVNVDVPETEDDMQQQVENTDMAERLRYLHVTSDRVTAGPLIVITVTIVRSYSNHICVSNF